jgi:hypothetical protein
MVAAVEETAATTPQAASTPQLGTDAPTDAPGAEGPPGFAARGRLRRRVRFLRKARELGYRDLGGLVFNLHRFGQRNDELVLGKLTTLGQIDTELRALESSLHEHQPVTVLREAGLTACPRCAAIHGSEDRFCPNCGLPLSRNVDLPIAGPATGQASAPTAAAAPGSDGPRARSAPASPAPTTRPASGSALPAPMPPARSSAPAPSSPGALGTGTSSGAPARSGTSEEPTEVVRPPSGSA